MVWRHHFGAEGEMVWTFAEKKAWANWTADVEYKAARKKEKVGPQRMLMDN